MSSNLTRRKYIGGGCKASKAKVLNPDRSERLVYVYVKSDQIGGNMSVIANLSEKEEAHGANYISQRVHFD